MPALAFSFSVSLYRQLCVCSTLVGFPRGLLLFNEHASMLLRYLKLFVLCLETLSISRVTVEIWHRQHRTHQELCKLSELAFSGEIAVLDLGRLRDQQD